MAYLRPACADTGQEVGKVGPALIHCPARSQVVAGSHDTDQVRNPRYRSVQHLGPQLSCTGPRRRHESEGQAPLWHWHDTICEASQMRGTDNKNQLKQHTKVFFFNVRSSVLGNNHSSDQIIWIMKNNYRYTFLPGTTAGMTSLCWRPVSRDVGHSFTLWRYPVPRPR